MALPEFKDGIHYSIFGEHPKKQSIDLAILERWLGHYRSFFVNCYETLLQQDEPIQNHELISRIRALIQTCAKAIQDRHLYFGGGKKSTELVNIGFYLELLLNHDALMKCSSSAIDLVTAEINTQITAWRSLKEQGDLDAPTMRTTAMTPDEADELIKR